MANDKLNILVACEYSGRVRDAFNAKGHYAVSCDTLPCESEQKGDHIQDDVRKYLNRGWDMLIAFPPCTYLTVTANKWYKDQPPRKSGVLVGAERREAREKAVEFFMVLANAPINKIAIENPIGVMSTRYRKPDQIIQPFQFGHPTKKATCLWLKNLPKLKPTKIVEPKLKKYRAKNKKSGFSYYGETHQTNKGGKARSLIYQGFADAMANQWSKTQPFQPNLI